MIARGPGTIVAYWLTPAEPARSFFASTIAKLAARYGSPPFEPHLTVFARKKGNKNPEHILRVALAGYAPIRLSLREIQCSDEFTKTVFLQFERNSSLSRLEKAFKEASSSNDEYELNPHLSLIYKKTTEQERVALVNSLHFPFNEVLFDSAKAIVSPARIGAREDVESWRVVAAHPLTE